MLTEKEVYEKHADEYERLIQREDLGTKDLRDFENLGGLCIS